MPVPLHGQSASRRSRTQTWRPGGQDDAGGVVVVVKVQGPGDMQRASQATRLWAYYMAETAGALSLTKTCTLVSDAPAG
jgi:hypothetical protein